MADLPLSKTIASSDLTALAEELTIVDRHFHAARPQHPMRRWEYAMALRALRHYETQTPSPNQIGQIVDVGGAGSPFWRMLSDAGFHRVQVIDPDENCTLEAHLQGNPPLADVVFCLSVLEHVEDVNHFAYHLSCLVAPGGLLFLTMDCCDVADAAPEDRYHFHWMRKRIFTAYSIGELTYHFGRRDFSLLGTGDFTWHGPQVYDYTFASLCLTKRP